MAGPRYAARKDSAVVAEPEVEIKPAEADLFPKFVGGGFYELSDGTRLQGKQKALDAQIEIN